jgi:hypothetical protein
VPTQHKLDFLTEKQERVRLQEEKVMPVFSKRIGSSALAPIIAGCFLTGVSSVEAAPIVNFNIQVHGATGGPFTTSFNQNGAATATPGIFNFNDGGSPVVGAGNEWSIDWDFNADDDPEGAGAAMGVQLGSVFTVKNNLAETANPAANHLQFSILVSMDTLPANAIGYIIGAANNLASTGEGPGVLSTTNEFGAGNALWTYQVNGSTLTTLFNSPYSLTTATNPGTNSSSSGSGGVLAGVPNNIGIRLVFDLSPGEEVEFNGNFAYIPSPGALLLLGLAGLTSRRRRV